MSLDLIQVHCQWQTSLGWYQSLCHHRLTLNSFMCMILHLKPFILDPTWTFQPTSLGEHIAPHWSTLEESCLSDAGWALDNLLVVAIPQSHSLMESVHLGLNWYILPMKCTHLHMVECPSLSQAWWEEVSYNGGSVMDLAHLPWCMRGHHLQLDVPLHAACPPINLWFPSSPGVGAPSLRQNN